MVEARDTTEDSREFVDNIVKDFLGEYVYVLTPKGEIIDLPIGSTPLDFAYRIHTNIGHHCQHAKVNGAVVRLDYTLKTNDVVEIITSNTQPGPSRDWLNIAKTQSAKNKIRQWFKRANREENIAKGREMLEESARRHGQDLSRIMKQEYISSILKNTISRMQRICMPPSVMVVYPPVRCSINSSSLTARQKSAVHTAEPGSRCRDACRFCGDTAS